jgi:hypoxia up-regulated 1
LGTREFDYRLSDLFIEKINKKHNTNIRENLRAIVKLNGELKKAREVLSANKEAAFLIEGLTSEIDFGDKLTREQFETMNEDLFSQIPGLLDSLLQLAEIKKEDVNGVEMVGGAVRIPKIQETVKKYFEKDTLDFHLNADEGAVFGAAFYAAGLSVQHRVKEMKLKDVTPWKVSVNVTDSQDDSEALEITQEGEEGENLDKFATLFRRGNRYGSRKTLSFFTNRPFKLDLKYDDDMLPEGIDPTIDSYVFDNLPTPDKYNFTGKPKVFIQYQLTTSGVIELLKAEAEITVTEYITKHKPKETIPEPENPSTDTTEPESETTEQETADKQDTQDTQESTEQEPTESETTKQETADENEKIEDDEIKEEPQTETESAEDKEPKKSVIEEPQEVVEIEEVTRTQRIPLHVISANRAKMPTQIFKRSIRTLKEYDEKDRIRIETENARNDLESYIYDTKDKLYDELVISLSTEEERETLSNYLSEAGDWLYDLQNGKLEDYTQKKEEVTAAADVIFERVREYFYAEAKKLMEEEKAKREAEEAAKAAEEAAKAGTTEQPTAETTETTEAETTPKEEPEQSTEEIPQEPEKTTDETTDSEKSKSDL